MPELPEVETYVRYLRPLLEGRRIMRFVTLWPKQAEPDPATVDRGITGKRIVRLHRRAKYIVADLADVRRKSLSKRNDEPYNGGHLLVHLRMTGRLERTDRRTPPPEHARASFRLDDGGTLWFCDSRKFGRIRYTEDLAAATEHLGVEPLERGFTADRLADLLRGRDRLLKPLLLDQALVAGLGNIYVDESLFQAGLHPLASARDLTDEQIRRLHRAIRSVLTKSIRLGGTSFDWVYPDGGMKKYLFVYGRTGLPCKRCSTPITALRVGQRGTHVCPRCQGKGDKIKRQRGN